MRAFVDGRDLGGLSWPSVRAVSMRGLCKTHGVSPVSNWAVCHFLSYLSALKQSHI